MKNTLRILASAVAALLLYGILTDNIYVAFDKSLQKQ